MGSEAVAFLEQPPGDIAVRRKGDSTTRRTRWQLLSLPLSTGMNWDEIDLPFIMGLTERIMGQTPGRKRLISSWN
jgi:hypothetical protein